MKYLPVILDALGFVSITAGIWLLGGAGFAAVTAGVLLIVAGYRAQS